MKIKNNKWINLWVKPRETYRRIVGSDPEGTLIPLAIIHGLLGSLIWLVLLWKEFPEGRERSSPVFFVTNIILGIIISLAILYLGSLLLKWTGRWLGGKGKYIPVKTALGWTYYPLIVSGIFALIAALLYGHGWAFIPFEVLKNIAFVWAIVILILMLSEAHAFSVWKALLAFIIAFVIGLLVFYAINFIVSGIAALISRS